jgi:HEAT repeat protein
LQRTTAGTVASGLESPADIRTQPPSGNNDPSRTRLVPLRPHTDWSLPETAADALGRIGPAAVPDLIRQLRSPRAERRWQAARILGRIGPDAAVAVPDLMVLLEDDDPRVRQASARTLGQIGPNAAVAVPALIRLMDESDR